MINLLKEAWGLYKKNFKIIFWVMLPAAIIAIPDMVYLESSLGLKTGGLKIPSDISSLILLLLSALIFLTVLIWSQFALSEGVKNKEMSHLNLYLLGGKKLPNIFKKIGFLWKLFTFKRLLFLFVIWFVFNGTTANIIESFTKNLWIEQPIFVFLNFLLLFPFFHMCGLVLLIDEKVIVK